MRKSKFTASVNTKVVEQIDQFAAKLKMSRSDVVEQAMHLWLRKQTEQEDEQYFLMVAAEMNADAKAWNATTSATLKNNREGNA